MGQKWKSKITLTFTFPKLSFPRQLNLPRVPFTLASLLRRGELLLRPAQERQADVKTLLKAFMSFSALEKLDYGPALSPDIHFFKSETSGELLCSPFNPGCLGKGIEDQSWTQMCGVTFAQVGKWVRGSTRTSGGQTHTGAEEASMCTGPWRGSSTPRSVLLVSSPLPTRSQAQRLTMSQGWVP